MTEKQDATEKKGPDLCENMPFAEAMRKMMGNQGTSSCCCPEIMSQMMSMCCQTQDKKEEMPKT